MRRMKWVAIFTVCCLGLAGFFGVAPAESEAMMAVKEFASSDLLCAKRVAFMDVVAYGPEHVAEGVTAANRKHGAGTCVVVSFGYSVVDASVRTFEWKEYRMALQKVLVSGVITSDGVVRIAPKPFEQYMAVAIGPIEPKKKL